MYAVIETGGKQYRVELGTELAVELLDVEAGQEITLERVLLVADGEHAAIGRPVVDGAVVSAEVLRQDRADKVISFKYRPKARRRVKKGHRQEQTVLRVTDVRLGDRSAAAIAAKERDAALSERQRLEEAAARQAAEDAALAAKLAATKAAAAAEEKPAPKRSRAKATETAETPATEAPSAESKAPAPKRSRAKAAAAAAETEAPASEPAAEAAPDAAPAKRSRTKKDA